MKRKAMKILSLVLATILILCLIPLPSMTAFAEGSSKIASLWADDYSLVVGDKWSEGGSEPVYKVWDAQVHVKTVDGDEYESNVYDVADWLKGKYPDEEFPVEYSDKSEDPSNGAAGDSFTTVYSIAGVEYSYMFHLVENPIREIEFHNVSIIEGNTYYDWEKGYDMYSFHPDVSVTFSDGASFEHWDCWNVENYILEHFGVFIPCWWEESVEQKPDQLLPPGDYQVTAHVKDTEYPYTATIVKNPIVSLEVLPSEIVCMEGSQEQRSDYEDPETHEWIPAEYMAFNVFPYRIQVETQNGYASGNPQFCIQWLERETGLHFDNWVEGDTQRPDNKWTAGNTYPLKFRLGGSSASYSVKIIDNPIVSITNDPKDITCYEGNQVSRWGYEDPETHEWIDEEFSAYDTYPHNVTVVTKDHGSYTGDWSECKSWLENTYYASMRDWMEGDDQTPANTWQVGAHPVVFHLGPATMSYNVNVVANPIKSLEAKGRRILEGDLSPRDGYYDSEKEEWIEESWWAYDCWPEYLKAVTTEGTFEGNPNDVVDKVCEAIGAKREDIRHGDINDNQTPDNVWTVGVHHERFELNGVFADYDQEIVESPVASITAQGSKVFSTYTEHGYWGPNGYEDIVWEKYNSDPGSVTVKFKNGTEFTGNVHECRSKIMDMTGMELGMQIEDGQTPTEKWQPGVHQVKLSLAGAEATYSVEVSATSPVQSVEILGTSYRWEGDTYTEYDYEKDGQLIHVDDGFQKYGVEPIIRVTLDKSQIVKGTQNVFSGHWELVRSDVAEALGYINPREITLQFASDQTPDNVWGAGEHDFTMKFGDKSVPGKFRVIDFPIAKFQINKVLIPQDEKVDYMDRYLDENDETIWTWPDTFEAYDADQFVGEGIFTYKNNVKKTINPWDLQNELIAAVMEEYGEEDPQKFAFMCETWTKQSPTVKWEPGKQKGIFFFGPLRAEYEIVILGGNGAYTGLYNDEANNRYIYLEDGFFNENYNGVVSGPVASVIDGKDPEKTTYVKDSAGKYEVENGVVKKKQDVREVFDDIPDGSWFVKAVQYAFDYGIMGGKGASFKPNDNISREEFVRVLYNHAGAPEVTVENPYADVKVGAWYANAVLWAKEKGIASGKKSKTGETIFGVGESISREEMAFMLSKYAELQGFDTSRDDTAINKFTDSTKVSKWAKNAMNWAVTQTVMSGKGGRLDPQGKASRAECASMIKNLLEKNKK